ncbi:MAG: GTP 3',8-cyclase MoaA [Phycisphaeraceae bacterium]|nr:GTP 3',8-cyclase MoaA [Phycisphaeraceae bacterium]
MFDRQHRHIHYLRLSLTSACQMRCTYCRPTVLHKDCHTPLTAADFQQVVERLVSVHGVRKVRLTGGDPTTRPDLISIIEHIAAIKGIDDLAMTTHGLTLASHARAYAAAGLHRVNVSLDTLDSEQFARITGVDAMQRVIDGIDEAIDAGLTPLKINTVVLRDSNEDQLADLVAFAASRSVGIRFIELMPMGPLADQWAKRYISADRMKSLLTENIVDTWEALPQGSDSAQVYQASLRDGSQEDIGFITPMSCHFCDACNRLRLTSDGAIYPCLMDQPRGSFLPALTPEFDGERFDELLEQALAYKAPEHPAQGVGIMTTIGG